MYCLLLVITLLTAWSAAPSAFAADNTIFISQCGQCHYKGGQAAPVNPADKAGLVWIKYFKRQRHPVPLTNLMTQAEMQNILAYLQDHAADSERPIAAAIPK